MKKPAKKYLIAARALIKKPENWCQGAFAVGTARCASEALCAVQKVETAVGTPAYKKLYRVMRQMDPEAADVSHFNDMHTHVEVLAAFNKAIKAA